KKLNPRLVILSVAAGDKNGLPSGHTLETIQQYPLLRTDQNGWIHITTDGEQMWVEADRQ
ncbi:MAG: MBL fold metallo-hydrolase, partial [Chloroflexi bacterium]|nr:MBL fold metallo-hydrolase [Chloroflexota bacterium]